MPVKVGFIGVGGIAQGFHLRALEKISDAQVVAVCDRDKEKVGQVAEKYHARAYTDYRKLLANEKLNACYVCVPPFAHGTIELELASRGVPMLVEKPVHLDLAIARKAAKIVQAKRLVSSSGYQDRYQDIIDRARQYLTRQEVALMIGYWMGGMPGVYWWRRRNMSGGQIVEQTTHVFDMARYLFGEVRTVFAGGRVGLMTDVLHYNVEDASAVTLQFESGLLGVAFSACCLKTGGRAGIDIYCKTARLEYAERSSLNIIEADHTEFFRMTTDLGLVENKAFIEAVKRRKPSLVRSSYPDAVKSLALCMAANESLKTRRPVAVRD
jgi:myo-inositol 2-dehydrogenase/D-chiro-inositol 1-dehydrogenase